MRNDRADNTNGNVLLSVDEILGLVHNDENADDEDDEDNENPSAVPMFLRSGSLGDRQPILPPPVQQRAQTWHATTKNEKNRGSGAADFRNGSSPRIRGRYIDSSRQFQQNLEQGLESPPSLPTPQHPRSQQGRQQQQRPRIVESNICPFPNRDPEQKANTTGHYSSKKTTRTNNTYLHRHPGVPPFHPPSNATVNTTVNATVNATANTTANTTTSNRKKPISRFELLEEKLREHEDSMGILL